MAPCGVFAHFNQLIAPHLVKAPFEVFGLSTLGHCRNIAVQHGEICGWHAPFVDIKAYFQFTNDFRWLLSNAKIIMNIQVHFPPSSPYILHTGPLKKSFTL